MIKPLYVLLVEDNTDDAALIVMELERAKYAVTCERVETADALKAALRHTLWDVVLCDFTLPEFSGRAALNIVKESDPNLPFIYVSATIGEESAVEAMQAGAHDYVMKGNLARLVPAVERELREVQIRKHKQHTERLLGLRTTALEAAANAIVIADRNGRIEWVNQALLDLTGYRAGEVIGQATRLLKSGCHDAAFYDELWQTILAGKVWRGEMINRRKDGSHYPEEQTITPVLDAGGEITHFIAVKQDISERKRAEEELKFRNTILATEQEVGIDGILVVDEGGKVVSCNQRLVQMWGLPPTLVQAQAAAAVLQFGTDQVADARGFQKRIKYLHQHRTESSREEVGLLDGRTFDCYTAPIIAPDQRYYGRVWNFRDVTAAKQAEQTMRESEHKYRHLFESLSDAAFLVDIVSRRTIDTNKQAEVLLSRPRREIVGMKFGASEQLAGVGKIFDEFAASEGPGRLGGYDAEISNTNATFTPVHADLTRILLHAKPMVLVLLRDVTERKLLEDQFRQAQKMEAIGLLAGGVAHDFNNMLAVIRGNTELVLMDAPQLGETATDYLKQVIAASERAANLTRQLLVFGRKQAVRLRPLNLNDAVVNITKMIHRLIGEDINLQCNYSRSPSFVQADVGMLEQVLLNLVINARDAMPGGGQLLLTTESMELGAEARRFHPEARPGQFIALSVTDTGMGISPEHVAHIFEPFYTTKEVGKGTGLGLATVYSIVKQHQGWIEVATHLGSGSTFRIFLPALPAPTEASELKVTLPFRHVGHERILLVEDDHAVRQSTRRILESAGYQVAEAASGHDALGIWQNRKANFDLVLTDAVLPDGMTGSELVERLRAHAPTLKVVFMSGYSSEIATHDTEFCRQSASLFLQKPFFSNTLLEGIRRCLDQDSQPAAREYAHRES